MRPLGTTPNPEQQLFTPAQVMAALQIGKSTFYNLVTSGDLGSCKIGKSRRVTRAQLDDFIRRMESGS